MAEITANKLAINLVKTNIIKCVTNNSPQHTSSTGYNEKSIEESINTKYPGLQTDNHLNCKKHINQLVPELNTACYTVMSTSHISNTDTIKSIYFAYYSSTVTYGIIFWGNYVTVERYLHYKRKSLE
jgi:hypothetical protein